MREILPVFSTNGSIGRSIITVEDELEISNNSPVSIFSIAKKHDLNKLTIIDDSFIEFPRLFKYSQKNNIDIIFGLNLIICNDVNDKTEDSLFSNCKVSVLMKNTDGYKDLIKLNNAINANANNFYYEPRGDWGILNKYLTNNLLLLIPSYNNFIHKNLLENGSCIPSFIDVKPIITYSKMDLPFDDILIKSLTNYSNNNNYELLETHPIYYYRESDFKSYSVYRCILNRSKFNNPNIDFFCSDKFSFESYLTKIGGKL